MAFWRASNGSEAGFAAFDTFSRDSTKYDPAATRARWEHYRTSPPTRIGVATLVYEARRTDPGFMKRRADRGASPDDEALEPLPDGSEHQIIKIAAGKLENITAEAAAALGRATLASPFGGHYRRGSMLVRPVRLADAGELKRHGIARTRGTLVIAAASEDGLRLALTTAARWEKFDSRVRKWLPADASRDVTGTILATAPDWADIPILTGIVEAPTLRPDGTVLDRPGYDPATGLLFDPGGLAFPHVPERPTRAEAEAALASLREILAEFPFMGAGSESTALSALITPRIRKACRAAPLHAITSFMMASGKTLLATLPGYISSGRVPAMMSQAEDPESEKKRLLATLIDGSEVNVIDNVENELCSDALSTIMTEPQFSDRLLGTSSRVTVPSCSTWIATGNNLTVSGDLSSRTISCALDPDCERPEEREFKLNLHDYVPEHRVELAAAALTVVRAYLVAGEPMRGRIPNFARFEDWSRLVREPLVWLGQDDPCAGRGRVEGRDAVRRQLLALIAAWHANYPGEAATVAEAISLATRDPTPDEPQADIDRRGRLRTAMAEIATRSQTIDSRALGNFISRHERRFEGGARFENVGLRHKVTLWKVVQPGGLGGSRGSVSPNARKLSGEESGSGSSYAHDSSIEVGGKDPPNPPNPPPHPGTDLEHWRKRYAEVRTFEDRLSLVLAWGEAFGGRVEGKNGSFGIVLPKGTTGLAQRELRRVAEEVGVRVFFAER